MMTRLCFAALMGLGLLATATAGLRIVSAAPAPKTGLSYEADTPCGHDFQIETTPHLVTEDDAVEVAYSAVWNSLPAPRHDSHEVLSNVIRLDAIYYLPEVSLPMVTGWGGKGEVGQLPSGTYGVEVYITTVITPIEYTEFCGSTTFVVYEQLYQVYVPLVLKQAALRPTMLRGE